MKLADLSPERRAWLARACWDRIIEKHEGPWDIERDGPPEERAEFLTLGGYEVLLPVASAEHPKISALWILPSEEGRILTIYLKNMQWAGADRGQVLARGRTPPGQVGQRRHEAGAPIHFHFHQQVGQVDRRDQRGQGRPRRTNAGRLLDPFQRREGELAALNARIGAPRQPPRNASGERVQVID